jgi:4-amino-4-deoxy-L-arabinose transferase-like glycosyltransferase
VVAGLGMQEKYSIALFGFGIVVGLLLTPQRRAFLNPWIWLGGLAAFLIFLPNLLWNIHYHWPFVELMHNIRAEGRDVVLLFDCILRSADAASRTPNRSHLADGALRAPLLHSVSSPFARSAGATWFATVFFVLHGKNYYLAPIYPDVAGGRSGNRIIDEAINQKRAWLKPVIAIVIAGRQRNSHSSNHRPSSFPDASSPTQERSPSNCR